MDVSEFLKRMGMKDNQPTQWDRVIQPNSSYLIVGDVCTGKSALAYWLLETNLLRRALRGFAPLLPCPPLLREGYHR